jgi:hypothetical protein
MSQGISNDDLIDLTRTTLENLPDLEFETALDFQRYPVCNIWFSKEKKQVDSGTAISRRILLDTSGNARHVRLYQKTAINVANVQHIITAPWVQAQTYWSIERRESLRNRAAARFVELVKSRRIDATLDQADLFERRGWSAPASASDDLNPYGLPYWISMLDNSESTAGAFNGDTVRYTGGTTSTTKGGIDAATETKWANWAASYTAINADFVKRLRKAFHATNFQSPTYVKDLMEGYNSNFRLYMNLDTLTEYEDLVTNQNDNLGKDLDPFHGNTTFKRVPIIYTPQLDAYTPGNSSTSCDPVFGVNHSKFFPIVMDGDWMREDEPMRDVENNNVITTFIDSSYQFFCKNVRQGGFVLHKVLAA